MANATVDTGLDTEFHRGLGLYDSTMVVVGSMIGSGIFIVSADMARLIGSPGGCSVAWLLTGLLTIVGALSYGELAAMMPGQAGNTSTFAKRSRRCGASSTAGRCFSSSRPARLPPSRVGFARYFGAMVPWIADDNYLIAPIHLSTGYALSLSTTQLVGILLIALLTWTNTRGLQYGKFIQNVFTTAKTGALLGLILAGRCSGGTRPRSSDNFGDLWTARGNVDRARAVGGRPRSGCSSRSACRRPVRCSRPTPGTTSPSPPAR